MLEYKSVVGKVIYLKYIPVKSETMYNQLVEEGEGFEEDKDEYTAKKYFMFRLMLCVLRFQRLLTRP